MVLHGYVQHFFFYFCDLREITNFFQKSFQKNVYKSVNT